MANTAATLSPKASFVVTLGDNFYNNGVSSSSDAFWSYLWKDVYITPYTDLAIPWYPVFGNRKN
jgi:acid phosphatase